LIAFSFNFPLIFKDFYKDKNRSAQIKGQNTTLLGCGCGKVGSGAFKPFFNFYGPMPENIKSD